LEAGGRGRRSVKPSGPARRPGDRTNPTGWKAPGRAPSGPAIPNRD